MPASSSRHARRSADISIVNGGLGFDDNDIFGREWTPRVSVAAYLRQHHPPTTPSGDTKVTFNAGKASRSRASTRNCHRCSLSCPRPPRQTLALEPIGPERSRNVDVGVEQGLAGGRGRVRVAYFDNAFDNLIEFVNEGVLPQLGVPPGGHSGGSRSAPT